MSPRRWQLKCSICGLSGDEAPHTKSDLVWLQEHVMSAHRYSREDLAKQEREPPFTTDENPEAEDSNFYIWIMPDGVDWLKAERIEE